MLIDSPDLIIFAQHGWDDTDKDIARLVQDLALPNNLVITPNLGRWRTWWRIQPLIVDVEKKATEIINKYPNVPIRIVGHSMGGLIWLEILHRHPEWWEKIHSLTLIGSPISGADAARIIDPLGIGIGIAKDLGINRRFLAETIARNIPTLMVASDLDGGSDGLVTLESTKFFYAQLTVLSGITHAALKYHPRVIKAIQSFWSNPLIAPAPTWDFATKLVRQLQTIPGMTDGHPRDFHRAKIHTSFSHNVSIRTWKNPLQLEHVFVADAEEKCLYAGFVGWLHTQELHRNLKQIQSKIELEN